MTEAGHRVSWTRREREQLVLRMIFDVGTFVDVQHRDRPDFALELGTEHPVGVEVTELYESQSHARIVNNPDYPSRLMAGQPHMHKDDVNTLKVVRTSITGPDGGLKHKDLPAILTEQPSDAQYSAALAETIRAKNERFPRYAGGFCHIDLVVLDHHWSQLRLGEEYASDAVLTDDVRPVLLASPFREVFLISKFKDGRGYRPLRLLYLLEQFKFYLSALVQHEEVEDTDKQADVDDVVTAFSYVMRHKGVPVRCTRIRQELCAVYGSAAVTLLPTGINVYDLGGQAWFSEVALPRCPLSPNELVEQVEQLDELADTHAFTCGVAFRVAEDAVL